MRVAGIAWMALAAGCGVVWGEPWPNGLGTAWRWSRLPAPVGEANTRVRDLAEAEDGTLWLATNQGSYWYDTYGWTAARGLPGMAARLRSSRRTELLILTGSIFAGGRHGFESMAAPPCTADGVAEDGANGLLVSCGNGIGVWSEGRWQARSTTAVVRGVGGETLHATEHSVWWADARGLHRRRHAEEQLFLAAPPGGGPPLLARMLAESETGSGIVAVDSPAELRGLWEWGRGEKPRRVVTEGSSLAAAGALHADGTAVMVYQSGQVRIRWQGTWRDAGAVPDFLRRARQLRFSRDGHLLLATAGAVYRFSPAGGRWDLHQHPFPDPRNTVNGLLLAADGSTWLATADGVEVVHRDGRHRWIRHLGADRLIACTGIAQDVHGDIWLTSGLTFGGAWRFDGQTWRHFGRAEGLTNQKLHSVAPSPNGALWFASTGHGTGDAAEEAGAWRWDGRVFSRLQQQDGLDSNRVYQVLERSDGTLWAVTSGALNRRDVAGRWRQWRKGHELPGQASPFGLTSTPAGDVFFADRNLGLGRVDAQGRVSYYSERDGLAAPEVWGVQAGEGGEVWAATSDGLSLWRTGAVAKITEANGGLRGHLWPVAVRGGRVCAGSLGNGWGCLAAETGERMPRVVMAQVFSAEEAVVAEWRVETPWSDPAPATVETRMRLDGGAWSAWSRKRRAELRELSAGEHRIEVQAKGGRAELSKVAGATFAHAGPLLRRWEFVVPLVLLLTLATGLVLVLAQRRQKHASDLASREARFRALLEQSTEGVLVCDPAGRVGHASGSAARTLVEKAEPGERCLGDYADARDGDALRQALANALQRRGAPQEVHFRAPQEGRLLHASITNRLQEPEVGGLVVNLRDVTEELQGRRELEESKERAETASRAKSEFLATMSHEIRTPMNGILGMASLLLELELNEEQRESALTIRDSCRSLLTLLNDILDISRIEAGRVELERAPFDLRECAQEIARLLSASAAAKGVGFAVDYPAEMPAWFWGDAGRIRQVLLNLAGNAVKFTAQGVVRMDITIEPAAEKFCVRCAVRDTGIGIAADKLPSLFEKFVQADASTTRKFGGTGLGLAISKSLAEMMGGSVRAESEPGVGSVFTVELYLDAAPAVASTEERVGGRATPGLRVLLAEDNPVNQRVATRMLERLACAVTLAENGRAAVDQAAQGEFDLVLMDCQMPLMDGFTATRTLRSSGFTAPIIALTANNMLGDRDRCLTAGMDDFLPKPMEFEDLARILERWSR